MDVLHSRAEFDATYGRPTIRSNAPAARYCKPMLPQYNAPIDAPHRLSERHKPRRNHPCARLALAPPVLLAIGELRLRAW